MVREYLIGSVTLCHASFCAAVQAERERERERDDDDALLFYRRGGEVASRWRIESSDCCVRPLHHLLRGSV
jgi:hypothetical protein